MEFGYSPKVMELQRRIDDFMDRFVIPAIPDWIDAVEAGEYPPQMVDDMKALAKRLLKKFDSFSATVSAEPADLKEVEGAGDFVVVTLKCVQAAALRLGLEEIIDQPSLAPSPPSGAWA